MLSIKNIQKSFGSKEVLKDLNFEVKSAGIFAILGKNGAGKTTLFRIIAGIEKMNSGEIHISGQTATNRKIGYLATEQYYYPRMLGKEYLQFCLHARKITDVDFNQYNEIFELPLNKQIDSYSSGMKKKLGIMGLLLQQNEIYLLDEPYNGLDIESVMLVSKILEKLAAQGKIIILSSHILSSITDLTQSIFYLKNGELTDFSNRNISELKNELLDEKSIHKLDSFFQNPKTSDKKVSNS